MRPSGWFLMAKHFGRAPLSFSIKTSTWSRSTGSSPKYQPSSFLSSNASKTGCSAKSKNAQKRLPDALNILPLSLLSVFPKSLPNGSEIPKSSLFRPTMSLMKPMYLKIPNLLPPELSFRVLTEPAQVNALLAEQDWADQAASLKNRVNSRIKSQPLESWIEWEGYFTDKGSSRDLGIFGVLYYN